MKKTQEQLTSEINAYITKTSQHLFSVDNKLITHVPFKDGSQLGFATIIISNDKLYINAYPMLSESTYNFYGNNSLSVRKDQCFPPYQKTVSIPYFKKMKQLVAEIKEHLTLNREQNKELSEKYSPMVSEVVSR
jgi:hypothetical protein